MARRREVEAQESAVRAYVAENEAMERQNRHRAEEARRRRNAADAERARIEMVRDSEIPQLEREAEAAETRLRQVDPDGIRRKLADVQTKLESLASQIAEAERLGERLLADLAKVRDEKAALEAKERELAVARATVERERDALKLKIKAASELEEALRKLRTEIRELEAKLREINALTISASELVRQAEALLQKARKIAPSTTESEPPPRSWLPWRRK
jgi:chromosome segregation ATPase